mmetsp:Transcript_30052/g.82504  ORF Transcript_30052/g.82504 Transcript_30052/m.82504 type:complete len:248 (-) Transcript_30052:891-1634(-)
MEVANCTIQCHFPLLLDEGAELRRQAVRCYSKHFRLQHVNDSRLYCLAIGKSLGEAPRERRRASSRDAGTLRVPHRCNQKAHALRQVLAHCWRESGQPSVVGPHQKIERGRLTAPRRNPACRLGDKPLDGFSDLLGIEPRHLLRELRRRRWRLAEEIAERSEGRGRLQVVLVIVDGFLASADLALRAGGLVGLDHAFKVDDVALAAQTVLDLHATLRLGRSDPSCGLGVELDPTFVQLHLVGRPVVW